MKKILDFISSKTFRNVFCFIVFTTLMTAAISSQNFFFQKIIENNLALREVIAQKDIKVVDTVKTEQHKKAVRFFAKNTRGKGGNVRRRGGGGGRAAFVAAGRVCFAR